MSLRVLVADDQALVRSGFVVLLRVAVCVSTFTLVVPASTATRPKAGQAQRLS